MAGEFDDKQAAGNESFDSANELADLRPGEPTTYETNPDRAESMARTGEKAEMHVAQAEQTLSDRNTADTSGSARLVVNGREALMGVKDAPGVASLRMSANFGRDAANRVEDRAGELHDRVEQAKASLADAQANLNAHTDQSNQ